MAVKQFYHDIDLVNVGQLVGARLQNVSTTARNALAAQLGPNNVGLTVWDTTENKQYTWNGAMFQADTVEVVGQVVFKGEITPANASTVERENGYQYVAGVDFTLTVGATTYELETGDLVLFTGMDTAVVTQRNDVTATETVSGNIKLATQAEVNAGMVMDEAVTPATLHGYVNPEFAADRARLTAVEAKNVEQDGRLDAVEAKNVEQDGRLAAAEAKNVEQDGRLDAVEARVDAIEVEQVEQNDRLNALEEEDLAQAGRLTSLEADRVKHFFASVNLTAGIAETVMHNLNLSDKDGFVIRTSFGGSDISLDVDSVTANSLTLTSLVPLSAVKVFVVGRAA